MSELIGQILLNRYRVDSFLGRGGMAEVYKVWDTRRSVFLALKMLREELAEDKVFLRRFKREAQTLAKLQHPNIVRFYGLEQDGAQAFMLMEYIEGTSLRREIFETRGTFPLPRLIEILRPVCAALNYAHQSGFVHCDIKPGNILIDRMNHVLVSDFGIARMTEAATATMAGAGTPAYMAPEQARGENPTPQTDIYALGILLFEMLSGGERPFTGDHAKTGGSTGEKIRWEQLNLPAPSLRKLNPKVTAELEAVVMKCLEKEANQRYTSTIELLNALTAAIPVAGTASEARSKPRSPKPASRRINPIGPVPPKRLFLIIGLPIIATLLIAGSILLAGRKPAPALVPIQSPTVTLFATVPSTSTPTTIPTKTPTPEPTPVGGGQVVFWSNREGGAIFRVNTDGTGLVKLGEVPNWWRGTYSREGKLYVYYSDGIWVLDLVSGAKRQLTDKADDYYPVVSPDGKFVAFQSTRSQRNLHIATPDASGVVTTYYDTDAFIINIDGSGLKRLDCLNDFNNAAFGNLGTYRPAAWSPDGRSILVDFYYSARTGNGYVSTYSSYLVAADCSSVSKFASGDVWGSDVTWSPDGNKTLYNNNKGIWVANAEGTNPIMVASFGWLPKWLPDGRILIHTSEDDYIVNPDGTGLALLNKEPVPGPDSEISPDGQWVATLVYTSDNGYDIFLMQLDGSQSLNLTQHPADDYIVGWWIP
jgi:serine/threonine protein kinase